MDNLDPTDFIITDDEIKSFFKTEEERARTEAERLEQAVETQLNDAYIAAEYSVLEKGSVRYEQLRQSFQAEVEVEIGLKDESDVGKLSLLREYKIASRVEATKKGEAIIINMTASLYREYLLLTKGNFTVEQSEYINNQKRMIAVHAVTKFSLQRTNPVLEVLNHAIPGEPIDLNSEVMSDYYIRVIERAANIGEDERKQNEFYTGLTELVGSFDVVSDEDFERTMNIKDSLAQLAFSILNDTAMTDDKKAEQLETIAYESGLEISDAKKIINYTVEHRSLLE